MPSARRQLPSERRLLLCCFLQSCCMKCGVDPRASEEASELERRVDRSGPDGYICKIDGRGHLVQYVTELLA